MKIPHRPRNFLNPIKSFGSFLATAQCDQINLMEVQMDADWSLFWRLGKLADVLELVLSVRFLQKSF